MKAGRRSLSSRITHLSLPIRGDRIELVAPSVDHVAATVRLMNDPAIARGTLHIPYPYSEKDARLWTRKSIRERRAGRSLGLRIVRRSDHEMLGGVGLHRLEEEAARAEIGYWLGKEYWGQGYATEAVNLLPQFGFSCLDLHRIEARIFPGNAASLRLARRCGFRYEGRLRDEVVKNGRWQATLLFARISTDPPPAPSGSPRRPTRRRSARRRAG